MFTRFASLSVRGRPRGAPSFEPVRSWLTQPTNRTGSSLTGRRGVLPIVITFLNTGMNTSRWAGTEAGTFRENSAAPPINTLLTEEGNSRGRREDLKDVGKH